MPYMMGGFPDPETSQAVADAYVEAGADLVELGVPFSDPLADGPVIHAAATEALAAAPRSRVPCPSASDSPGGSGGADGLLEHDPGARSGASSHGCSPTPAPRGRSSPTCPLDEAGEIAEELRERRHPAGSAGGADDARRASAPDLRVAPRASSTWSPTRGSTGERDELPPGLAELVGAVREESSVPVAVGFGIGTPEQAAAVGRIADGVIIGTRLVRAVAEADGSGQASEAVGEFIRAVRGAIDEAGRAVG